MQASPKRGLSVVILLFAMAATVAWGQPCPDADSDGYADCLVPGCDPTGLLCGDCDDDPTTGPAVNPAAVEACNQLDDDCNGLVDEGFSQPAATLTVADADGRVNDEYGGAVAVIGDVDGDGVTDFAVGSAMDDDSISNGGKVVVYSGVDRSPICQAYDPSPSSSDNLGASVAGIGDVSGDGVPDFAAGASLASTAQGANAGAVLLFSGADCQFLRKLTDPSGTNQAVLGTSVAGIGDLDADGWPDVLAGAPGDDGSRGAVVLFSGLDGTVIRRHTDPAAVFNDFLGQSVAAIDDVDGDSLPDILGGAYREDTAGSDTGSVFLFSGATGAVVRQFTDPTPVTGDWLGWSVASIGDLDGDSVPDVLAGARLQSNAQGSNAGGIVVFSGIDGTVLIELVDPTADSQANLGYSVSAVPDIGGDGLPDVAAGAWQKDTSQGGNAGAVLVFDSVTGSVLHELDDAGGAQNDELGTALAVGDVSGDGAPEFLAGAPQDDNLEELAVGKVLVFSFEADCDGDGLSPFAGDCDDTDVTAFTGNVEVCDTVDNDCDGLTDEDGDGDGSDVCADCDDTRPDRFPGNPEICDGVDNDCAGGVDDGPDADADTFSAPCDCNDDPGAGGASFFPGAVEACDREDNDCDGAVDEDSAQPLTFENVQDTDWVANDESGRAVAAIGDVDLDGVPDFAVGSHRHDVPTTDAGEVVVYSGADRSVVCRLTHPSASPADFFGFSIAGIDDVDDDGVGDIAVGAYQDDDPFSAAGSVLLYSGAGCAHLRTLTDPTGSVSDNLGWSVAGIQDLNGDGRGDVIAGVYGLDLPDYADGGGVVVFSGGDGAVLYRSVDPNGRFRDRLGSSVAAIGDVDFDGVPDIAAGAPEDDSIAGNDSGSVVLFSGADGSYIRKLIDADATAADRVGTAVAGIGDVSGDGVPDILAGAPRNDIQATDAGAVVIFSGADGSVFNRLTDPSSSVSAWLGTSVASIADLDGDGRSDVVAGAVQDDTPLANNTGSVAVFSSVTGNRLYRFEDPEARDDDDFGVSVAVVGDVSGDGMPEILAGAPLAEDAEEFSVGKGVLLAFESDCDGDGINVFGKDCDDAEPASFPGNTEICDSLDNDCDGLTDEDSDGDGSPVCSDCDDTNPSVYPGNVEICDGVDNDCVGGPDDGPDADADTFTAPCDCNDDAGAGGAAINPGATELCNRIDDDCSVVVDDTFSLLTVAKDVTDPDELPFDELGHSVAGLGDVTGDGVPDFVAGVWQDDNAMGTAAGKAVVFSGADQSVWCEAIDTTAGIGENLGWSAAGLGDLSGDGIDDFAVGARRHNGPGGNNSGSVVIFSGTDCDVVRKLVDPAALAGAELGHSVGRMEDLNGDGFDEVLAGAWQDDTTGPAGGGSATVFSGIDGAVLLRLTDPNRRPADQLGVSVASVGDVDADGVPDIAVGADRDDTLRGNDSGSVLLFSGFDGSVIRKLIDSGGSGGDRLGISVAGVGDLSGDGVPDIAAGAWGDDTIASSAGKVVIFSGLDGSVVRDMTDPGGSLSANLGWSLAALEDVNGDAVGDLVAGAVNDDTGVSNDAGSVVVFSGADGAILHKLTDPLGALGDDFGDSVAVVGDFSGDGLPEILVGAPLAESVEEQSVGKVVVFSIDADCDVDGVSPFGGDCDDTDPNNFPGNIEICEPGFDNDCDGLIDEDSDGDGVAVCADCDDADPRRFPGNPEVCDGLDNDCAGGPDDGPDADGDTFFAPCDCNDDPAQGGAAFNPLAPEICDHLDNDCDGVPDETFGMPLVDLKLLDPMGSASALFGQSVADVGDVDGDGFNDYAVGATGADDQAPNAGKVVLFSGRFRQWICNATAPDGVGPDSLGQSVAGIGDVTGDGVPDFAAGAHRDDSENGSVSIFSGADCAFVRKMSDPTAPPGANLGWSVAGLPDLDGDTVPDLVAGAPLDDVQFFGDGSAVVFSSASGAVLFRLSDPNGRQSDALGRSVAGIGDVNADGVPDIAAGAPGDSNLSGNSLGSVSLFSGADGSHIRKLVDTTPFATNALLGTSVARIDDLDDDGVDDIASGAPQAFTSGANAGEVILFSGADGSVIAELVDPAGASSTVGASIAVVPDLDGDGFQEIVAGAPFADLPVANGGHVLIFSTGSGDVLMTLDDSDVEANDNLGRALAVVGDISNGGLFEILGGSAIDDDAALGQNAGSILLWAFEDDCDGDGLEPLLDCDDLEASLQELPGEVDGLMFTDPVTLTWDAPTPGGDPALVVYDTLRSDGDPTQLVAPATCVESDDGADLTSTDVAVPSPGMIFYYQIRAGHGCGDGPLGTYSDGSTVRTGRECP